jgi:hypothetical protein
LLECTGGLDQVRVRVVVCFPGRRLAYKGVRARVTGFTQLVLPLIVGGLFAVGALSFGYGATCVGVVAFDPIELVVRTLGHPRV